MAYGITYGMELACGVAPSPKSILETGLTSWR